MPPVELALVEGDRVLATGLAAGWRNDLEDTRQGDGRCGFRLLPPDDLYDGEEHTFSLRLPDGEPLTAEPTNLSRRPSRSGLRYGSSRS